MDWNIKLDELKKAYSFINDDQLADYLRIRRGFIHILRSELLGCPLALKFKILDRIGYIKFLSMLALAMPSSIAKKMIRSAKLRSRRIIYKNTSPAREIKKYIEVETKFLLLSFFELRVLGMSYGEVQEKLRLENERIKNV